MQFGLVMTYVAIAKIKLDDTCKLKAVIPSYRAARGHLASVGKEAMQTKKMRRWTFLLVIFHRVTLLHKKFGLFLKQSLNWYLVYSEHYFRIFHQIKNPFDFLAFSLSDFFTWSCEGNPNSSIAACPKNSRFGLGQST